MLIKTNEEFDTRRGTFFKTRSEQNRELHILSCYAVYSACKDGRCDLLNSLWTGLDTLSKDGLRAWLSPRASTFDTPEITAFIKDNPEFERPAWIAFKKDHFEIIKGTVAARPSLAIIEEVERNFDKKFLMEKSAAQANRESNWSMQIIQQVKRLEGSIKKQLDDPKRDAMAKQHLENLFKVVHELTVDTEREIGAFAIEPETAPENWDRPSNENVAEEPRAKARKALARIAA